MLNFKYSMLCVNKIVATNVDKTSFLNTLFVDVGYWHTAISLIRLLKQISWKYSQSLDYQAN